VNLNLCETLGVAIALDALQTYPNQKTFWRPLAFEEAYGDVRGRRHHARFQEQTPCKLPDVIKNALQIPGEF